MSRIIGIDLGTTNSVVAIMEGREPKVIVNEEGSLITPSVVAWGERGEVLVGQIAKRQAVTNPENTIFSAKRFIGRKFDEMSAEMKRVPYKLERATNGDCAFSIRGKATSPQEVSAKVLAKLKKAAEDYLGEKVTEAVITVPAYFNDAQRQATKDAGRIAGLDVKRIVNEPTAAALAYGLDKKKDEIIAVYDFGGGTFDISILEVGDNIVQVISTNGDTHLGGDDVDALIVDWMVAEFLKSSGIDVGKDKMALQRLRESAEKAKIELSNLAETSINLPFLTVGPGGPVHMDLKLSRLKLEQMIEPLVARTMEPVKKALADSKKTVKEIVEVVLVGGSTRIPMVKEAVKKFFGQDPHQGVNPDEVVAVGAAVQAGILSGDVKDMVLLDVTPLSLGVETMGGVMTVMIPRNTTLPTQKKEVFSTAADSQPSVDIHVLQGERTEASANRTLGRFSLDGIMPAARGVPKVEVSFDIDANGILSVKARDQATGKDQHITITASSGLSEAEIQKMVKEAATHETEDKSRREQVDRRNKLDNLCYSMDKTLKDTGKDKFPAADFELLQSLVQQGRDAVDARDDARITAATEKLEAEAQRVAARAYAAADVQGAPGAAGAAPPTPAKNKSSNASVVDAEFEDAAPLMRRRGGSRASALAWRGGAALSFVAYLLVTPVKSFDGILVAFAVCLSIDGAFAIASGSFATESRARWLEVGDGLAGVVCGVLLLAWRGASSGDAVLLIGGWALVSGLLELAAAWRMRDDFRGAELWVASLLSLALGALLFVRPPLHGEPTIFAMDLGTYALVFGLAYVVAASRIRRALVVPSGPLTQLRRTTRTPGP